MNTLLLMAQQPIFDGLKGGLRGGFNSRETVGADLNLFFWLMMVVAAFLIGLLVVSRRRQRRALNITEAHPAKFYGRALRHLGVGWFDEAILEWLSRRAGVMHPSAMLIHPDVFNAYSSKISNSVQSGPLRDYVVRRFAMIRSLAFDEADSGADPSTP